MVCGLHLYMTLSFLNGQALYNLPLLHPLTSMQGAGLPIVSNMGFGVLLKDTWTCGGTRDEG